MWQLDDFADRFAVLIEPGKFAIASNVDGAVWPTVHGGGVEIDLPVLHRFAVGVEDVNLGSRAFLGCAEWLGRCDQADNATLRVQAKCLEGQPLLALHNHRGDDLVRGLKLVGRLRGNPRTDCWHRIVCRCGLRLGQRSGWNNLRLVVGSGVTGNQGQDDQNWTGKLHHRLRNYVDGILSQKVTIKVREPNTPEVNTLRNFYISLFA